MISAEQAQREGQRQAIRSAREKSIPLALWPEDLTVDGWRNVRIPFLGDRPSIRSPLGPPMWKRADVWELLHDYPYKWFFVDSSGFGAKGEAALTIDGFRQLLNVYSAAARTAGYEVGIGVVEVGQFQVHVAPYLRSL